MFNSSKMPAKTSTKKKRSGSIGIGQHLDQLQARSSSILIQTLKGDGAVQLAKSRHHAVELTLWSDKIANRREHELFRLAAVEHEYALLSLAQGHYRHAFKGLRLVLELSLQAIYLSVDEIALREWLQNRRDTSWAAITKDEDGIFSKPFAQAFFPELEIHLHHYKGLAKTIYRECSEAVHGNIPTSVPIPDQLIYSKSTAELWHQKSAAAIGVIHFATTMRYLKDFTQTDLTAMEPVLQERLGHIPQIREIFGGPTAS